MHAMLSNDYKRKLCCMAVGAPAAFQSENTRVRPPIIDVFHVRSSSTARHTKCNSRQTRRGSASPQSAHTSSLIIICVACHLSSVRYNILSPLRRLQLRSYPSVTILSSQYSLKSTQCLPVLTSSEHMYW